ncbi:MAG TPA: HAD family phosphatase [Thermomicrobiales bacterium]|nr:HAD family phosphatase [Thermomicrobiales bacterium]
MNENPPFRALIFDMDGLLVDSEGLATEAMNRLLDGRGLPRRPEIHERLLGRRLVEALAIVREGYEIEDDVDVLVAHYADLRTEALRGSVQPMPGALEIVKRARLGGSAVGLATSGMRIHVDISLGETGLAGLFDSETTGDEVSRGKPAPDLFLLAAERLGMAPNDVIVLEDSPLGVEAARNAGMRVIGVLGHPNRVASFPVEPTVLVQDLFEAADWLGLPALDEA